MNSERLLIIKNKLKAFKVDEKVKPILVAGGLLVIVTFILYMLGYVRQNHAKNI